MMGSRLVSLAVAVVFAAKLCGVDSFVPVSSSLRSVQLFSDPGSQADSDSATGFRYDNSESISPLEKKKAMLDTATWCLERCIKLGHCEVFEDLNQMSTAQVQDFCKACVLTGEATNDECDVSMMFADDAPWAGKKPEDVMLQPM